MTVVSLKTENSRLNGVYKVKFLDGSSLFLASNYLSEGLKSVFWEKLAPNTGKKNTIALHSEWELSDDEEKAFSFAAACYKAEKAALRLITRAEQNSLGLTAKLKRRFFDCAVVKTVVSSLVDRDLLDDGRYAELWIRSSLSLRKAPSPLYLLSALGRKGIDRASSRKALDKVLDPETEYALLLRYLEKLRVPEREKADHLRVQLKNQGFSSEAINRYFDS